MARGLVAILLGGVALGLGYNWIGLRSHPPRGIPWIAADAAIPDLESLTPRDSTMAAPDSGTGARGAAATPGTGPGRSTAVAGTEPARASGSKPIGASSPARVATGATSRAGEAHSPAPSTEPGAKPPPPPPPAPAPSAAGPAGTPPPATSSAPTRIGVPLPFIPETDQPVKVRMATVKAFFDADAALFLDARDATEYEAGHIPRALRMNRQDALNDPDRVKALPVKGRPIIVYCEGGECEASIDLAHALIDDGYRKVLVYAGGFPEWSAAGQPVEKGKGSP